MDFERLCLVVTDRCTASCDHCYLSCSPKGRQVMDQELIGRSICEAKEQGIKIVRFSGGEPFLYPALLEEGARLAKQAGMKVEIATNGYWGDWEYDRIIGTLEKSRPDLVEVGYDVFHQKHIRVETIRRALAACEKLEIEARVLVADMAGAYGAGEFIQSLGDNRFGLQYRIYPLRRCGRAKGLPSDVFLRESTELPCGEETLCVLPSGGQYSKSYVLRGG